MPNSRFKQQTLSFWTCQWYWVRWEDIKKYHGNNGCHCIFLFFSFSFFLPDSEDSHEVLSSAIRDTKEKVFDKFSPSIFDRYKLLRLKFITSISFLPAEPSTAPNDIKAAGLSVSEILVSWRHSKESLGRPQGFEVLIQNITQCVRDMGGGVPLFVVYWKSHSTMCAKNLILVTGVAERKQIIYTVWIMQRLL